MEPTRTKQLLLFQTPVSATFDTLGTTLQPLIPDLWWCINDAFQSVITRIEGGDKDFIAMDVGELAQFLQAAIRRRLLEKFPAGNVHGVRFLRNKRIFELVYGEVSIRIKKYRWDLSISNYATHHNSEYWANYPS